MAWEEPELLPTEISALLVELGAPPRLEAHLRLVQQAAIEVLAGVAHRWPQLEVDRAAVLFGAATHDIGKALHRDELRSPGSEHEEAGRGLLEARGFAPAMARFAVTHAGWKRGSPGELEDLLVALADNCWKGARPSELETSICLALEARLGIEQWEVFSELDELVTSVAAHAEERLEWQGQHPT